MPKTTDSVIFSETQKSILETALQNPEMSNSEVADETGTRLTLVRDTRAKYEDEVELADDVKESGTESESVNKSSRVDADDLSETEQSIVDLAAADPTLTNAEIAVETGARISLVRDTRDQHGALIDAASENAATADPDDSDESETATEIAETTTETTKLSDTQQAIVDLAADDPSLTNSEIADRTGARITLVRDTRAQYDASNGSSTTATQTDSTTATPTDSTKTTPTIDDVESFSETQIEILETALGNPDLTNGEVATKTGTRIPLVRDTISAYEADDTEESTDTVPKTEHDESTAEIDTDAFSETQIEILKTALESPDLTNAEIADETGTRITLVRDTIFEHEYDEKPWDSDLDDETDDSAESGDDGVDVAEPDDEEIEVPDTTAADVFSTAQRSILETALKNPELTNAEIAEQTGTRLTLVRDTRATYADGVALAEDDQNEQTTAPASESKPESKMSERTLSDTQRAILKAAADDSGQTNAEIAEKTGARLTLVRDTREQYEDEIDLADDTDTTASPSETQPEDTDSTGDTNVGSTTDTNVGSPENTEDDGPRAGLLVGILLVVLLALGLAVAVGAI